MEVSENNKNRKKKRRLLIPLLILYTISLSIVGYLFGRASGISGYYGQLIDTIVLDSHANTKTESENLTIRGRVCYSNGEPYRNGVVELHSDPQYTTTDNDGYFTFSNVEPGKHTVSVIQNGTVLAKCDVNLDKTAQSSEVLNVQQSDGSYLIEMPIKYLVVNVELVVKNDALEITDVSGSEDTAAVTSPVPTAEPVAPVSPEPSSVRPSPEPSGGSITPTPSATPVPSVTPTDSGSSSGSTGGESAAATPHIEAGDSYSSAVWTQMSSIDIFAVRDGNFGVQSIGGDNVLAPGSYGKYIFKIKNPDSYSILYGIKLAESDSNVPNLPLKYRISKGISGTDYIGGSDWKDALDISVSSYELSGGDTQYYTLEWKWVTESDSQDTAIGTQSSIPSYILNIIINAETK